MFDSESCFNIVENEIQLYPGQNSILNFNGYIPNGLDNTIINLNVTPKHNEDLQKTIILNANIESLNLGDINFDNSIDILDITQIIQIILGLYIPNNIELQVADMNFDQSIDLLDIISIVNIILNV